MDRYCVICKMRIWHVESRFCSAHHRFASLWSAVATGRTSDWYPNTGGWVRHAEMQLSVPRSDYEQPYWVAVADINRMARYWLDVAWDEGSSDGELFGRAA